MRFFLWLLSSQLLLCGGASLPTVQSGEQLLQPSDERLPPEAMLRLGSLRLAHGSPLTCVRFSADDQWVASADSAGMIRLWDFASGSLVQEWPSGTGREMAFSPDGKWLAIGGFYNPTTRLWDLQQHTWGHRLPTNARSLTFSPDSAKLATAGSDAIVRLWNVESGTIAQQFKGHQGALYAVAISPDGKSLASGGGGDGTAAVDNEVRLWNIATGEEIAQLREDASSPNHLSGWIYAISFSFDNRTLAAATPYAVTTWNLKTYQPLQSLRTGSSDVAFAPAGNRLVTAGKLNIYVPTASQPVTTGFSDATDTVCVAYSNNGRWIATGSRQGRVQLWDAQHGTQQVRRWGHDAGVRAAAISPDGNLAASISRGDANIRLWGLATGRILQTFPVRWQGSDVWWNEEGSNIRFTPDGRELMTWTSAGTVHFWRVSDGRQRQLQLNIQSVTAGTFSFDATLVALVEYNGSTSRIRLFELDGGTNVGQFDPIDASGNSDAWISALAFSPDGDCLAIGVLNARSPAELSPAPSVQIWDISSGKIKRKLRPALAPPGNIVFSPDGTLLATSAVSGTPLQIWQVTDGQELHRRPVKADTYGRDPAPLAFSSDSKRLAAADAQRVITVWELSTGQQTHTYQGHAMAVTSLAFSPDHARLISSSEDATCLLWNLSDLTTSHVSWSANSLQELWQSLADADAQVAAAAMRELRRSPEQAIRTIDRRWTPEILRKPDELQQQLKALLSDDVPKQLQAVSRLVSIGDAARPALMQALKTATTTTQKQRIEEIMAIIDRYPIPAATLQRTRAVALLEQFATPAAEQLLERLSDQQPPTPSSRDAEAALQRLRQRTFQAR